MSEHDKCEVCGGEGDYPIIDMHGSERYYITCPECFGSGEQWEEDVEEDPSLPPPSTAARIKSVEQLKAHLAREAKRSKTSPEQNSQPEREERGR